GELVAGSANTGERQTISLSAYGRQVGSLSFERPRASLRAADRRLLDDLAAQLGSLLHAYALTSDLQHARERLVLAREEERRRLRRDLHDGLGPALAGLTLKADTVRALVVPDPAGAAECLETLRDDLQTTVIDVRRLVEGLRPPALDELGLALAVDQ